MSHAPKKLSPKPVLERARKPKPAEKAKPEERVKVGEYLILKCPGCERNVKLNSAYVGRRMGCGFCKAPLEIIEQDVDKSEIKKDWKGRQKKADSIVRKPLAFRVLNKEDIAEDSDLEFSDEFERRRLPFEAPLWDEEENDGKAPKKKLLTHREQVFRSITYVIMAASFTVVGVILYSAIVRTMTVANKDDQTLGELPADVQAKIAAVTSQEKPISMFLTSAEEQAALAIVNGFVNAPTVESRLPFVRDPDRVRPLMEQWYRREGIVTDWPDGEVTLRDKVVDQDRYFIRLAINFTGTGYRLFAVEQTRESFRLDWETATGYQPMRFKDFQAARPTTPIEFRVKLKSSDYYNFQFSDDEKYRAVELSYPGQPDFKLMGYFKLSQPWGPLLAAKLDAGEGPSLVVTLKYPDEISKGDDLNQVEIISILSETWWQ